MLLRLTEKRLLRRPRVVFVNTDHILIAREARLLHGTWLRLRGRLRVLRVNDSPEWITDHMG